MVKFSQAIVDNQSQKLVKLEVPAQEAVLTKRSERLFLLKEKEREEKKMAGRIYCSNVVEGMRKLYDRMNNPQSKTTARVSLIPKRFFGTKVMPFKTFGVTAGIDIEGKIFTGTGVAPMATSGGVREPKAIENIDDAKANVKILEAWLNQKIVDPLSPLAVEEMVMRVDSEIARQRSLEDPRPTSGIGSEVAIAATYALLEAQAAYFQIPTSLALRTMLLHMQGKEPDVKGLTTPVPKFNILNFGVHSGTKREDGLPHVWLQETKVAPIGAPDFNSAVEMGVAVLTEVIKIAGVDNVGFEAGISPALTSPEQVYEMSLKAIENAGLSGKVFLAADAAASEFSDPVSEGSDKFEYRLSPGEKPLDAEGMVNFWKKMTGQYPIVSIEDGMHSEDTIGWKLLMKELGGRIEIQGDDLFVTDPDEVARLGDCANSILIKPNQAGTIVRTLRAIAAARTLGYTISPSHRSGKVPGGYGIIPELTLGTQAEWIKPGAPRRERQGFLNNVIQAVNELSLLGIEVGYAGPVLAKRFNI